MTLLHIVVHVVFSVTQGHKGMLVFFFFYNTTLVHRVRHPTPLLFVGAMAMKPTLTCGGRRLRKQIVVKQTALIGALM